MPSPKRSRPTIADVAERAGVSKMAVSFALNGRPGVSDATRARVVAAADELGWRPNPVARSLSSARAGAVGLVLARSAEGLQSDTFYMQLIAGIQSELARSSTALVLQIATDRRSELHMLRRLAAERRVDAVLVTDVLVEDPRFALLDELGVPFVTLGGPDGASGPLRNDDDRAMAIVLDHLRGIGRRVVVRVAGAAELLYSQRRTAGFVVGAAARGMEGRVVHAPGPEFAAAVRATERILAAGAPPEAIVYESDVMAAAGMTVLRRAGIAVPDRVAIVAWGDSVVCEVTEPPLTALRRDVVGAGREAARMLVRASGGDPAPPGPEGRVPEPVLVVRRSTLVGPAARADRP